MKTKKTIIYAALATLVLTAVILSCNSPLALGEKLDLEGPLVEFTAPAPRKAINDTFNLEGRVSDKSAVQRLSIKTSTNNRVFPKQWQYIKGTGWQVSQDHGASWQSFNDAKWVESGTQVSWSVAIDLTIDGEDPPDGEYMFTAQAWDAGGMSDDNSLKTIVLIFDTDPPIVDVFNPYLFSRFSYSSVTNEFSGELEDTLDASSTPDQWRKPELLGKFLTQEFRMQWQIEDSHDIWSIEFLFYEHDVNIDGILETEVPQDYIYYYHENLPPPELDPSKNIKPNGSLWVPDLGGTPGKYDGDKYKGGELGKKLEGRTVVKVVSICYDAAGWKNRENVIGYFIFWPEAAASWITYTDGMFEPAEHASDSEAIFKEKAFMIYPGRNIRANAFQAQGVSKVEFSLHLYDISETGEERIGDPISLGFMENSFAEMNAAFVAGSDRKKVEVHNPPRASGSYSTTFSWFFKPEARSRDYVVKAVAYDVEGRAGLPKNAVFRVQDITFPDFPFPPNPTASKPLFEFIGRPEADGKPNNVPAGSIRISGIVADATEIKSLYMVWINPQSESYKAMSQLSYFRDSGYGGWKGAIQAGITDGGVWEEREVTLDGTVWKPFDPTYPNKIWKLKVGSSLGEDPETGRIFFPYEQAVRMLEDLNIGSDKLPLESQIFLLRAENPDGRCSIITYAPPGDTIVPEIKIDLMKVGKNEYKSGEGLVQIPQFNDPEPNVQADVETIEVTGSWKEDSTYYLDSTEFYGKMRFSINSLVFDRHGNRYERMDSQSPIGTVNGISVTVSPAVTTQAREGSFTITAIVGSSISNRSLRTTDLKDTLALNVSVRDVGNNPAEDGASWLIESDTLRFLWISSSAEDRAYKYVAPPDTLNEGKIRIFIEFNKPVILKPNRLRDPVLRLNTGGIATYESGQNSESTQHYFSYTVGQSHNTDDLNVNGISIDGGANALGTGETGTASDYPFTFIHTNTADIDPTHWTTEEIRLTRNPSHNGSEITGGGSKVFYRAVPVDPNGTEKQYTLGGVRNIVVDNTAPSISSVSVSPEGWHKAGVEIFITATFNETVRLGSTPPVLTLGTATTPNMGTTSSNLNDIRVSGNSITFKYTVKTTDATGTSPLQIRGITGDILDVPGNIAARDVTRDLTGVFLDTNAPTVPTVTVWQGTTASPGAQISSPGGNLYYNNVFVRITGTGAANDNINMGRVEYSLNDTGTGATWTSSTAVTTNIQLTNNGTYNISARQIDRAGNISTTSTKITFNLDMGTLITSINSTTPNGQYTWHSGRQGDKVEIQVNFRKALTFPANTDQILTLNVTGGAANSNRAIFRPSSVTTTSQATFIYSVVDANTTSGERLNVTGRTFSITDGSYDVPDVALTLPAAENNLGRLKDITIVTGALLPVTNPTQPVVTQTGTDEQTRAADSWTGTINITFNRPISKGSGDIIIAQSATGYRLPAVLTEAQSTRYRSAANFNANYTRGTNGFINGSGSDTTTKYVLNYDVDTIVTPVNNGTPIQQMAHDFLTAETITLPLTSQDVTITGTTGNTLTITLTSSNALQALGASYTVTIPQNGVRDSLGYTWPTATGGQAYTYNTPLVNKSFVRVNKQINKDTVARTTGNGSATNPWLTSTQVLQTTARLDCRTPNSVVRYSATGTEYTASGSTANGNTNRDQVNSRNDWTNTDDASNRVDSGTQTDPTNSGTYYTTFTGTGTAAAGPHISVGTNTTQGYVWRITTRGRTSQTAGAYSDMSEEIAFRTVLTVQLDGMINSSLGAYPGSGDQLWIRGGDAVSSSSVPGFPLTWSDDYNTLSAEGKRAGIRLLRLDTATTNFATSRWKWVTWEINVQTYYDVVLGRDENTGSTPDAGRAWQYGPRTWAYQRGGWSVLKDLYRLYPGKHRWIRVNNVDYQPGGALNFSHTFSNRPDLATSIP